MRLSLWTQYSSNHSTYFSVCGVFKTLAEAEKAEVELRHIFETIAEWYIKNGLMWSDEVTPPEIAFGKQYDIEWSDPIDCVDGHRDAKNIARRFDRLITISNPDQTHMSKTLFETLLSKLGAEIIAGYDTDSLEDGSGTASYLILELRCTAPGPETAIAIVEKWRARYAADSSTLLHHEGQMLSIDHAAAEDVEDLLLELKFKNCTNIEYQWKKEIIR